MGVWGSRNDWRTKSSLVELLYPVLSNIFPTCRLSGPAQLCRIEGRRIKIVVRKEGTDRTFGHEGRKQVVFSAVPQLIDPDVIDRALRVVRASSFRSALRDPRISIRSRLRSFASCRHLLLRQILPVAHALQDAVLVQCP